MGTWLKPLKSITSIKSNDTESSQTLKPKFKPTMYMAGDIFENGSF